MVENPNRKVEKLLPEERLGGNGLFARITVSPAGRSTIMSTTAKPKPITSSPARAYTATTARSVPFMLRLAL